MKAIRIFALISVILALSGCGGDRGSSRAGRLSLTVQWPPPSRLIPAASNSIKAVVTQGATVLGNQLMVRPIEANWTTTVTFDNLPAGDVTLTTTAFPAPDGTGVAQATGAAPASIVAGQTTAVTVTMNSTIVRVDVTPALPSIPVAGTVQLLATPKDAAGNVVLVPISNFSWQSANTANATVSSPVNPTTVTGVAAGSSVITATESESGIQGSTTVTVTSVVPSGRIVFLSPSFFKVMSMDDGTGANLTGFGAAGNGTGQFGYPVDVAFDNSGRVFIADNSLARIVRMDDLNGTNWTTFGGHGSGVGQFESPESIAIDSSGRIYITDRLNSRIVRMDDMTGANWTTFGTQGSGIGQFINPRKICLDSSGRIYVCDWFNHRIVRIDDMTGANWTTFGSFGTTVGHFNNPQSVFVDANGRIYIADRDNRQVVRMDDMNGTNWTGFTIGKPTGVFVAPSGRIYILDPLNDRIARIDDMSGSNLVALTVTFNATFPPIGIVLR